MVLTAGQNNLKLKLNWTDEDEQAFVNLITPMSTAPIIVSLDYSKPFKLFETDKKEYVNAGLTQDIGGGQQPIA